VREPLHPLDRPLPPDVAAGESAFIQFYQKYTVFSWQWAWRRTALFGSIGALAGISFGISHGLYVRSIAEGVTVSLACAGANVLLVGAGPLLAALFRHRVGPPRVQRGLVIAAVLCGMALGAASGEWATNYHDGRMADHARHMGRAPKAEPTPEVGDVHDLVRHGLTVSRDLLILFLASGGLALHAYFSEKKRWTEHWRRVELEKLSLEKSEADLKLTVLQAQVEPHFLFNTLASVRSLVASDPARATQTIDALAAHLRATLPKLRADTGSPQSTLGEQFDICASYLELMKVRLGERLRVTLRLPDDLRGAPFPPLLLISLVENAVKHGAEPKPAATHVVLAARAAGEGAARRLEVSVEDDGAGLAAGVGDGTGLANIRAQLRMRYGAAAALELAPRAFGGVLARLVVPFDGPGA
jgi:hypothetical protein